MKIGTVEIPIVHSIDEGNEAEVDEIAPLHHLDRVAVKHEPSVESLTISGYLNEEMHSGVLTLAEQKEDVKSLRTNDVTENSFNYRDYHGYLLVENVDLTDNLDSKIVNEVVLEVRYFPWPKYYPENKP